MSLVNDPLRVAEDDRLRSNHVRKLVQQPLLTRSHPGPVTIPKTIVQFWHDLGAIPGDVVECLDSWQPLDQRGFRRLLFDDAQARRFIDEHFGDRHLAAFERCRHPAMRCDYFRLCYILSSGGFYVDADDVYRADDCESLFRDSRLKLQPLCYDATTARMVKADVFIGHKHYSPDWIFYVNNNPLIAPPSHPVVHLALIRATSLLLNGGGGQIDIQSTTGPGNLTASLVRHSLASGQAGREQDFMLLADWESIATSRWPLSYRNDERNWRLWDPRACCLAKACSHPRISRPASSRSEKVLGQDE